MRWFTSLLFTGLILAAAATAQDQPAKTQNQGATPPVFKTETRLVPVDVIVTDKKGVYIRGLEQKNFKVWEDNKEQSIRTFAFEADPALPAGQQKRYMVLFFDVASMTAGDQIQARQTAAKFIDSNAGPNRLMAIVNFTGAMQVAQNFTEDIERLKQVVAGVKVAVMGADSPGGMTSLGGPRLGGETNYGARTMTLALRSLARNLTEIPGRKTLVLFSAGFPLTPELMSQVTAAIDACNKANVAIYPVDVRGLTGGLPFMNPRGALLPGQWRNAGVALAAGPVQRIASALALFAPQRGTAGTGTSSGGAAPSGGGAAPSGGGTTGGGTGAGAGGSPAASRGVGMGGGVTSGRTGSDSVGAGSMPGGTGGVGNNNGGRSGTGGGASDSMTNRPMDRTPRDPLTERRGMIIPIIPESASTNQQVLYMLADGTGGFVIANTNDLLGGLEKINQEQNQYYLLSYVPPESLEGSCHSIRVKVDRGGTVVRARTGYCNVKSTDVLSGKPVERQLETRINGSEGGTLAVQPMQLPFFFTSPNTARVNVAMDIPVSTIKFEKVKGKFHAEINILGIAYRNETSVAARFSDVVKLDFEEKKEMEAFQKKALRYENQFDIASGQYTLKVAFNAGGEAFGKLESPLNIDAYDPKLFSISGIALSKDYTKANDLDASMDSVLLEGRTPLMAAGLQIKPAGGNRFKTTDPVVLYFELYEPALAEATPATPVRLGVVLRILDRKTGESRLDSGGIEVTNYARAGNPVVPVGLKLPLANLPAGSYKVEIVGANSPQSRVVRTADFDVM